MIRFACPKCGARLSAKEDIVGQTRQCPKCGTALVVPAPQTDGVGSDLSARHQSAPAHADSVPSGAASGSYTAPQQGEALNPSASGTAVPNAKQQTAAVASGSSVAAEEAADPADARGADQAAKKRLPLPEWPQRLNRNNCYLICGRHKIVAAWQNNGEGWMLKSGANWISAIRNRDQLPTQGDFVLVELKFSEPGQPRKLIGIRCYKLAQRWALTTLDKGDDHIMGKIVELGCLNKDQKAAVRTAIKEMFMHQLWEDAHQVWEFLNDADYHSSGVG